MPSGQLSNLVQAKIALSLSRNLETFLSSFSLSYDILSGLSGFYEEPADITVYIGQKAHFSCYVDANPPPRIKWLKDERPLQIDDLRMTVLPSGALEIDEVIENDQASYR